MDWPVGLPQFKFMPVPRCDECKHWERSQTVPTRGQCCYPINNQKSGKMWPEMYDEIHTTADFGCVEWEKK